MSKELFIEAYFAQLPDKAIVYTIFGASFIDFSFVILLRLIQSAIEINHTKEKTSCSSSSHHKKSPESFFSFRQLQRTTC